MPWWNFAPTSYLPSLPSLPAVPLPANLQHRLVAFLLKRALGAFVKPESWEGEQGARVEADVRRGVFRVNELEVDPVAINSLLSSSSSSDDPMDDVPGPLQFVSGKLNSVTANVVYPTLSLTSLSSAGGDAKLDLEVDGVELVFQVCCASSSTPEDTKETKADLSASTSTAGAAPVRPSRPRTLSSISFSSSSTASTSVSSSPTNRAHHPLTESTLSLAVAHEFITTSLSPREESELRASLQLPPSSISASINLPGAFGGARREEGGAGGAGGPPLVPQEDEVEEVEAGMLAGVVERILARLSVTVRKISVGLIWEAEEGEMELVLRVDEVVCRGAVEPTGEEKGVGVTGAATRSVSFTPPKLFLRTSRAEKPPSPPSSAPASPSPSPDYDYSPLTSSFTSPPASRTAPPFRRDSSSSSDSSTDSSGDESDFLAMSMSIADLRTSTASLSATRSSTTTGGGSRMFASARSFAPVQEGEEEGEEEEGERAGQEMGRREDDPFQNPDDEDEDDEESAFRTPQGSPAPARGVEAQLHSPPQEKVASPSPPSPAVEEEEPFEEHVILSLGSPSPSAAPLVFFLTTSVPAPSAPTLPSRANKPEITLSASLEGGWTIALTAAQLATLISLSTLLTSLSPPDSPYSSAQPGPPPALPTPSPPFRLDLRLSALTVLLSYPSSPSSPSTAPHTSPFTLDRIWSSPDPDAFPSSSIDAPHLRLRLEEISLSSAARGGVEVGIESVSLAETSSSRGVDGTKEGWRTLPVFVNDPKLPETVMENGTAEAVDWAREGAEEGMEKWGKDGRYLGGGRKGKKREEKEQTEERKRAAVRVILGGTGGGGHMRLGPVHAMVDASVIKRIGGLVEALGAAGGTEGDERARKRTTSASTASTAAGKTPRPLTPTALAEAAAFSSPFSPRPPSSPGSSGSKLSLSCPLFRLSLRILPPSSFARTRTDPLALRSGRLLLDLSNLAFSTASSPRTASRTISAQTSSLDVRFAPLSSSSAVFIGRITSLGPFTEDSSAALPSLSVTLSPSSEPDVALALPLVHVSLDKPIFDGLQLFADDVSQFSASLTSSQHVDENDEEGGGGYGLGGRREKEKIIGSRYFGAKSFAPGRRRKGSGGRGEGGAMEESTATLKAEHDEDKGMRTLRVKVEVTDAVVDLALDHLDSPSKPEEVKIDEAKKQDRRYLRASLSDLSATIELFKGGKDDLRAKVGVMDVKLEDLSSGLRDAILSRTLPRNLTDPTPFSPVLKLDFASSAEPETSLKESSIGLGVQNVTYSLTAEVSWLEELAVFAKAPEGAFEGVVPTELTSINISLASLSVLMSAPTLTSQIVLSLTSASLSTDIVPDAPRTTLDASIGGLRAWAVNSEADLVPLDSVGGGTARYEAEWWKRRGFVQLAEVEKGSLVVKVGNGLALPDLELLVSNAKVEVAICADSIASLSRFAEDLASAPAFQPKQPKSSAPRTTRRSASRRTPADLLASVDPAAFEHAPALQDYPEILDDDVPTNLDYLADALNQTNLKPKKHGRVGSGVSFGGGDGQGEPLSEVDGETIRMLSPKGLEIVDEYLAESRVHLTDHEGVFPAPPFPFAQLTFSAPRSAPASKLRCRLSNTDVTIHLHEGYDWFTTRKAIEEEAKAVRRRLEKIRQLLSTGQMPDSSAETKASVLMFGSVQLGLPPGASELPPKDLLAAINEELDDNSDAVSTTSSWQTFGGAPPASSTPRRPAPAVVGKARKKLTRSRTFAIEINLRNLSASYDTYPSLPSSFNPSQSLYTSMLLPSSRSQLASKLAANVGAFEIIDNIKTSTWRKFLTELRPSDGGVVRATGAPMAKLEMSTVRPIKISPLRLYIDQDALEFLKAFGAFELPAASGKATPPPSAQSEPFFQRVEVFPVKLKLDYKPKRVDYNALRNGKTAELMNFFHFDGSEMTLRHLVVTGISGASTLSSLVQDIWTPDVKAHQLADVISGIAPVRSVVSVGAGVANLVLLPIEQYRKDGRVVRGLQKGAQAFAKQTTLEAINVGAKLATGTQVILEQAEHVLGAKFSTPVSAEVPPSPTSLAGAGGSSSTGGGGIGAAVEDALSDDERLEVRSRYANQPANVKQGVESAYKSLGENFKEAAQTILAVPMEVYERSGSEGPVRAVVRAVPIAVLKPMIGASGAVSKALLGLRNTFDPDAQQGELEDKYKAPGRSG
ncbi:hypothetical protein JCM8547_000101 [Rhodosporidiobolus lusitaniae]